MKARITIANDTYCETFELCEPGDIYALEIEVDQEVLIHWQGILDQYGKVQSEMKLAYEHGRMTERINK